MPSPSCKSAGCCYKLLSLLTVHTAPLPTTPWAPHVHEVRDHVASLGRAPRYWQVPLPRTASAGGTGRLGFCPPVVPSSSHTHSSYLPFSQWKSLSDEKLFFRINQGRIDFSPPCYDSGWIKALVTCKQMAEWGEALVMPRA